MKNKKQLTEAQIEKKADKLGDLILEKQREVDDLLDELYKLDEQSGAEICELLQEGEY